MKRAEEERDFKIDYEQILQELDNALPPVPQRPKIEQVNPPPYKIPRAMMGLWPKEDESADKKKKVKKKPPPKRKKDEIPKKLYPWADPPQRPPPTALEIQRDLKK